MIHVNSGQFGAVGPKNPRLQAVLDPRPQSPENLINSINRDTDQIAFTAGAHAANINLSSAATYHIKDRTLPRLTPLPKEMADEITRLYKAENKAEAIAAIMNKTQQHPYDMSTRRVNAYVKWGDTGAEVYLPYDKPIPPGMLKEINSLLDNKVGACDITTAICDNLQHPYAIRLSRITSHIQRRDPFNRQLLDPNTPIPEGMQQEIHRLAKRNTSPKAIVRKMRDDPRHPFQIADSRVKQYLLGERALPSHEPIPESMLQEIDRLFASGKKATAIATAMNKDPKHPYAIPHTRVASYLPRKVDGHRGLPSDKPIPESMLHEIDRLAQSGKRARAIATVMNGNPEHPYAIFAPRIQTYLEQVGISTRRLRRNQAIPENFIFPKRHRSVRTWQIEAAAAGSHANAQRNFQEFDEIDLDAVLDGIIGDKTAQFDFNPFGKVSSSYNDLMA